MPTTFANMNDACRGLLLTATRVMNQSGAHYAIAGGWVPILCSSNHPTLTHPGTRDVDILLMGEPSTVRSAAQALIFARFRPSAKHEFQLLREAQIDNDVFVFNVDLMHASECSDTPEMFHDIIDLGIKDDYDPSGSRHVKSIAFKSSRIVYEQQLFKSVSVSGTDFDGNRTDCRVVILSPAAAILSKAESVAQAKRTRDAFDIYYIISGPDGTSCAAELKCLSAKFPDVSKQLSHLEKFLTSRQQQFNENVWMHARGQKPDAASLIRNLLFAS